MIAEDVQAWAGLQGGEDDQRHAVIDIGSNTVRLVIYGGPQRAPVVLWNEKVDARLGRDLAGSGRIPASAMGVALEALARYALIVRESGIARIDTVATAAVREAKNGVDFAERVAELGLAVRVLSGEEEACASAYGAIGAFPNADGVVADLGGGSLELVAVADGACGEGATFPLGTLRLAALRQSGDLARKVELMLAGARWARGRGPLYMIGGTWRALAAYAMRAADHPLTDPHGLTLGIDEAASLAEQVARAEPSELARKRGVSKMRADKLPDAASLLQVLLSELEPQGLIFSSWGLREGLYFQTLTPGERAEDPLLSGIVAFAAPRSGRDADPAKIAEWIAPIARDDGERAASLRLGAAHLAVALHAVEPNLRAAQALDWALEKRWVGIDFAGRAMLAAALRGSLGVTDADPSLARLASEGALREATSWGLALRLAQRLGGGASSPLTASQLSIDGGEVELQVPGGLAALVTAPVEKDLAALACWLGARPRLTVRA